MTTPQVRHSRPLGPARSGRIRHPGGATLGVGAMVAMVLCCAGPALVAAGALGSLGAFLANPVVLAGLVVAAGGLVSAGRLRSRRAGCLRWRGCGRVFRWTLTGD